MELIENLHNFILEHRHNQMQYFFHLAFEYYVISYIRLYINIINLILNLEGPFTISNRELPRTLVKWGAYPRWSFGPTSAWNSIETTTIGKAHPTLEF